MARKTVEEVIEFPEGVSASFEKEVLKVKGPKGEASKIFNTPKADIKVEGNKVIFSIKEGTKRQVAILKAYIAHAKNMMEGVTNGYVYKLKICSGHFPMNVSIKDNKLSVKNFIGEKVPRTLNIRPGVNVKVKGDLIELDGVDKELVGQAAASIEQLTRRPGFDRRIFQDGIFIIHKAGKDIE